MGRNNSTNSLEVAKRAGVSQATVSYVLNNREGQSISESTRARVLDAARELKYRPNRLANGVLRGKSSVIGLIAPWLESSFHVSILNGIREEIEQAGYHALVAWGKHRAEDQAEEVELLREHRVEGIVYICEGSDVRGHASAWLKGVVDDHLPCVVIDDRTLSPLVDCVVSDDLGGAALAVEHLVGLGHRRISYWSAYWDSSTYGDRLQGYKDGLARAGILFDPSLCVPFPESPRRTAIQLRKCLSVPAPPTAIFASGDVQAMIIRHAAEDLGIAVPEELAVVGYSDQAYAIYNDITSIRQNSHEMGRAGARRLLHRLKVPNQPAEVTSVATELVVRSSTVAQQRGHRFDQDD